MKRCPKCGSSMCIRDGKYGKFYYCPSRYMGCPQGTISVNPSYTKELVRKQRVLTKEQRSLEGIAYALRPTYEEIIAKEFRKAILKETGRFW